LEATFASVLTDFTSTALGRMYIASAATTVLAFCWMKLKLTLADRASAACVPPLS
jgi:hypothetical protein